jgi:hypothetical protein
VFWRLGERSGRRQLLQGFHGKTPVGFPGEEVIFGMVLNRPVDLNSELGGYDGSDLTLSRPATRRLIPGPLGSQGFGVYSLSGS